MKNVKTTFSLMFYIKKKKLLRKNGEAPICLRITCNGSYSEVMIKRSIPIHLWDQQKECSKGKDHIARELNHYINGMRARVLNAHRELEIDGELITAQKIKEKYIGKDINPLMLVEYYKTHNKEIEKQLGKDYQGATVKKYKYTLNHIEIFLKAKKKCNDFPLREINNAFLKDFENYLKGKGLMINSVARHMQNLRKVLYEALKSNYIKTNPFFGFKVKHEETHIDFLTLEEVKALMEKQFDLPRLELVRDIFIFCCFTGLAYSDVFQLKYSHLIKDNNSDLWIRKNRQKTKVESSIPLMEVPKAIIEKYKKDPFCQQTGLVLPVYSNQKMNSYLKEIADLCGIQKKLTTHIARHSHSSFLVENQ